MADRLTPDEIQKIFDARADALKKGKTITAQMDKALKDAETGIRNYTNKLNQSLGSLGRSATSMARSLKDGKTGFRVYNDVIGSTADVVANVASRFGLLGAVFGTLVKAAGAYTKAVNKQADALMDGYKEMSQAGLTGAQGVSGVFENMQKMGYGIADLGKMADLLKENADVLATLGGNAATGAAQFAEFAGSIQRSGDQEKLRLMGISIDDINKGTAAYMRQQAMIGRNRMMTGDELRAKTVDYLRESDAMRKLTGKSQEQQEEILNKAMRQEAFNQTMFDLEQKAGQGDEDAANQIAKLREVMLSNLPEDMKDLIKGAVGGDYAAADKVNRTAPQAMRMLLDKKVSTGKTMDSFRDEISTGMELRGHQAKMNTYTEDYLDIVDQRKFVASMQGKHYDELKDHVKHAQVVTDKATKSVITMETAQLNARDELQSMLQKGIIPLANAMGVLGKAAGIVVDVPGMMSDSLKAGAGKLAPVAKPEAKPAAAAPAQKISGMEDAKQMVIAHEGIRLQPYKDTKGLWTVGVGHLIGDGHTLPPDMNRQFTKQEVMDMFESDFAKHVKIAEQTPGYDKANAAGKAAFVDLAFNMGKWWPKFPTTSKALEKGDFASAAQGLQNSAWYTQVGNRGPKIVALVSSAGKGFKDGGVPTGPTSGYTTTLHGTEAVVPMKSNKKMPINISAMQKGLADRTVLFEQNLAKITDIVRIMGDQVDISQKIFRAAH